MQLISLDVVTSLYCSSSKNVHNVRSEAHEVGVDGSQAREEHSVNISQLSKAIKGGDKYIVVVGCTDLCSKMGGHTNLLN